MNDRRLDGFGLFIKADHHRDYFHRVPAKLLRRVPPFADSETLYSWPLRQEHLAAGSQQVVRIRLDADARWDIDHVGVQVALAPVAHRVFLSHAGADKPIARQLANGLRARGIGVWLDEAEMQVGDSLLSKISNAIGSVEYVVALLSHASVASPWVQKELSLAMHDEVAGSTAKVLPVRIAPVKVPTFLRDKVYLDCTSDDAIPSVVEQIATKVLAGPRPPASTRARAV